MVNMQHLRTVRSMHGQLSANQRFVGFWVNHCLPEDLDCLPNLNYVAGKITV